MANIFAKQADITQHPNRNNMSLTKNVYGTYKAGYLYPNYCRIIPPTSSIRINTKMFMNFMPTAYPLQSGMRIIQHFFAVPLRLLWKDFENWSMRLAPDKVPPYIDLPAEKIGTGSLFDYLEVPTTVLSDDFIDIRKRFNGLYASPTSDDGGQVYAYHFPATGLRHNDAPSLTMDDFMNVGGFITENSSDLLARNMIVGSRRCANTTPVLIGNGWSQPAMPEIPLKNIVGYALDVSGYVNKSDVRLTISPYLGGTFVPVWNTPTSRLCIAIFCSEEKNVPFVDCHLRYVGGTGTYEGNRILNWYTDDNERISELLSSYVDGSAYLCLLQEFTSTGTTNQKPFAEWLFPADFSEPVEMSSIDGVNPFYSSSNQGADTRRLSAMAPRAYEMIYNSFYRNKTGNQPFIVDGETKYNDWLPNHEGGSDTYEYNLHQRNWELDAFTSCLPSPQMGDAPLVGITNVDALGNIRFQNEDGSITEIGRVTKDGDSVQVIDTNSQTEEQRRSLVNFSSGISIADFRQTNAFQTFLEQTLRTGLTYYDFIRGHFGKGPKKAELQMPEFIGGTSTQVTVNMISNTNADGDVPLGSYAGQASAFGEQRHSCSYYADDFTVIMGIMCIVPDCSYSQIIAPHWKLDDPLDLYYPEFGQLGMQPITYADFMPIQSKLASLKDSNKKLTDVFGYQRPNWDMVWAPDTLHGEFRRTLNRYVVNRRFGNRPELGNEFLMIDPAEVSRSFVVTTAEAGSGDDIAVGQIRHEVVIKQPVHKVVVPSLGR